MSSVPQADIKKQGVDETLGDDPSTTPDKEKERSAEIVKRATTAFLNYRRELTAIIAPELGTIDDLTVTWLAMYTNEKKGDPLKKFGRMHVSLHTKTPPEPETGRQVFNSFSVDSNVSFERDLHPAVEAQEDKKTAEEKEAKKETPPPPPQSEKIDEIISAAAARSSV